MEPEVTASEKGYQFGTDTERLIGLATTVHRELGPGFLEFTYQCALAVELQQAGIAFQREVDIPIYYRDTLIDTRRADIMVGEIILELKAVEHILPEHISQLAMYLKASRHKLGLILNFGSPKLQIKRVVR